MKHAAPFCMSLTNVLLLFWWMKWFLSMCFVLKNNSESTWAWHTWVNNWVFNPSYSIQKSFRRMPNFSEILSECISFNVIICSSTGLFYRKQCRGLLEIQKQRQSYPNRAKPLHNPDPLEGAGLFWFLISALLPFVLISSETILKELMLCYKSYWVSGTFFNEKMMALGWGGWGTGSHIATASQVLSPEKIVKNWNLSILIPSHLTILNLVNSTSSIW